MTGSIHTREDFEGPLSNDELNDADLSVVQEMVSEAHRDLHSLDAKIAETQAILDTLVQDRVKAAKRLEKLQAWTAPHKRIPPEILARIFLYCLGGNGVQVPPRSAQAMPWILGHICSRWREIMLGEPQLWDNIGVTANGDLPDGVMQDVFSRSGTIGIKLDVNSVRHSEVILTTILNHTKRFRSIVLPITTHNSRYLAEMASFERLEALKLHYYNHLDTSQPFITNLDVSPTLRELDLVYHSSSIDVLPLHDVGIHPTSFIWTHLNRISMDGNIVVAPATMLDILKECQVLVTCNVTFMLEDMPNTLTRETLHLMVPALQYLEAKSEDVNLGVFLTSLTLPSLRVLRLHNQPTQPWPQEELLGLFGRSACRLEEFYTNHHNTPLGCVIPLLGAFPAVTKLTIHTTHPISDSMIGTIVSENLLPALEYISLWTESSEAALKLLENRWLKEPDRGICGDIIITRGTSGKDGFNRLKIAVAKYDLKKKIKITYRKRFS